jgi:hypothetical protein
MWHFRCKNCPTKVTEACQTCEVQRFLRDCQAALDLIGWYRDSYHHADFGHREMMAQLKWIITSVEETGQIDATHRTMLRDVEQRVDHWLYQTI